MPEDDDASALDDAGEFLESELQFGARPAKSLLLDGKHAGHSERTLKRAKSRLGIESRKTGTVWEWFKGVKGAKGANDSTSENHGTVGTLGTVQAAREAF